MLAPYTTPDTSRDADPARSAGEVLPHRQRSADTGKAAMPELEPAQDRLLLAAQAMGSARARAGSTLPGSGIGRSWSCSNRCAGSHIASRPGPRRCTIQSRDLNAGTLGQVRVMLFFDGELMAKSVRHNLAFNTLRNAQSRDLILWFRRHARLRPPSVAGNKREMPSPAAMIRLKVARAPQEFWASLDSTR